MKLEGNHKPVAINLYYPHLIIQSHMHYNLLHFNLRLYDGIMSFESSVSKK